MRAGLVLAAILLSFSATDALAQAPAETQPRPVRRKSMLAAYALSVGATITPAAVGGFLIDVQVHKELEDLPAPMHSGGGLAVLRTEAPIERQTEVVTPLIPTHGWIPIGRDHALERVILERMRECL